MMGELEVRMVRKGWMIAAVVGLVVLLAGAAYVGGRLLGSPSPVDDSPPVVLSDSGGGVSTQGSMVETEPAAEMPETAPDVAGLYVRREDNRLFLGTGSLSAVKVEGVWEYHHDGPVVEIVTTHDTRVYRDDTLQQVGEELPSGPLQQVLTPTIVDEIDGRCAVSAWGERRGDRLVAEVVVFYVNG
jgi:hypothetical protein